MAIGKPAGVTPISKLAWMSSSLALDRSRSSFSMTSARRTSSRTLRLPFCSSAAFQCASAETSASARSTSSGQPMSVSMRSSACCAPRLGLRPLAQ